jgi:hypothetical protein
VSVESAFPYCSYVVARIVPEHQREILREMPAEEDHGSVHVRAFGKKSRRGSGEKMAGVPESHHLFGGYEASGNHPFAG